METFWQAVHSVSIFQGPLGYNWRWTARVIAGWNYYQRRRWLDSARGAHAKCPVVETTVSR